jgi:hypothetical protein
MDKLFVVRTDSNTLENLRQPILRWGYAEWQQQQQKRQSTMAEKLPAVQPLIVQPLSLSEFCHRKLV